MKSGIEKSIEKAFENKRGYSISGRKICLYKEGEKDIHLNQAKKNGDIIFKIIPSYGGAELDSKPIIKINLSTGEILDYTTDDPSAEEIIKKALWQAYISGYLTRLPLIETRNPLHLYKIIKYIPKEPIESPFGMVKHINLKVPWLKKDCGRLDSYYLMNEVRNIISLLQYNFNRYSYNTMDRLTQKTEKTLGDVLEFYKKEINNRFRYKIEKGCIEITVGKEKFNSEEEYNSPPPDEDSREMEKGEEAELLLG